MSLQLRIVINTQIEKEYYGSISISFPEMNIHQKCFGFVFLTKGDGASEGVVSRNCSTFIDFETMRNEISFVCINNYGGRTELLCGIFFNAIKLGIGSIISFVRQNQTRVTLPITREVVWRVNDDECVHGVVCLACGIEKTLEKK